MQETHGCEFIQCFVTKARKIPCAISYILASKGIGFIHHFEEGAGGRLLGLRGFDGRAPLVALRLDQVTVSTVGKGRLSSLGKQSLPLVEQLLACESIKDLLNLDGKGPTTVNGQHILSK